jgi:putative transposase
VRDDGVLVDLEPATPPQAEGAGVEPAADDHDAERGLLCQFGGEPVVDESVPDGKRHVRLRQRAELLGHLPRPVVHESVRERVTGDRAVAGRIVVPDAQGPVGRLDRIRFLVHDHDSKFNGAFDEVFRSEGIKVIHTPIRAPQANAYVERFVRTARAEYLDWLLITGRRHLETVLRTYTAHYNRERPHRGLALHPPERAAATQQQNTGKIERRDRLGGLIREYHRAAA